MKRLILITIAVFFLMAGSASAYTIQGGDAASGVVRPSLFGQYMRYRAVLTDGGGADTSHTFSLKAYGQR